MPIPNPFSPKKAQTTVFEEVIKLFWAGIVILVIFVVAIALINLIVSPADSGSKASYTRIFDSCNALLDERTEEKYCVIQANYLQTNWAVVGFNEDGILAADWEDDKGLECRRGQECTVEKAGWLESEITKPDKCGTGPCLCLCQGANKYFGAGDVDGDDCEENNAICMPMPYEFREQGFNSFYVINTDAGECPMKYKAPASSEIRGSYCDLVIDSEKWYGADMNIIYALVISEAEGLPATGSADSRSLVFDVVETEEEFIKFYGGEASQAPQCTDIIERLKHWQPQQQPVEGPEKQEEETLYEHIAEEQSQGVTVAG